MPGLQKREDRTVRLLIENYVHFKHLFKKGKTTKKDVFQKIADRFKRVVQGGLWHGSQTEKLEDHGSRI